jgi:IrrE N-terminal-like domain
MPATPLSPDPIALTGGLDDLRVAVERKRGRTLILTPAPLTQGSTLLIETGSADVIIVSQADSPADQLQAIAHHLAHLMCGHQGAPDDHLLQRVFPRLAPGKASASLTTSRYAPEEEREAEAQATRFVAHGTRSPGTRSPRPPQPPITTRPGHRHQSPPTACF